MMDQPNMWKPYQETIDLLTYIKQKCAGTLLLPCAPATAVVDYNEYVVGILTETNQFVRLIPAQPIAELNNTLRTLRNTDFVIADKEIQTAEESSAEEGDHSIYIRNVRLQSQFYVAFRNTVRHAINLYANRHIRQQIRNIGMDKQLTYRDKRKAIIAALHPIVTPFILFRDYDPETLSVLGAMTVHECTSSSTNEVPFCSAPKSGNKLIIPRTNLNGTLASPGKENSLVFFHQVADELVRFRSLQSYIMQPNAIYLEGTVNYQVNANEVILTGSVFDETYFRNLIPFPQHIKHTTYETAPPQKQLPNPAIPWSEQLELIRTEHKSSVMASSANAPSTTTTRRRTPSPKEPEVKKNKTKRR
jgi:hypothetical protein